MRDDPTLTNLVTRAREGDQQAWDALVERYAPLVWSVARKYRLDRADAEDVGQTVWLRLVDQLARLRDPDALPGWLLTTTRRECIHALDAARRSSTLGLVPGAEDIPDPQAVAAEQELLGAERRAALREAFTGLLRTSSGCWACSSRTRPFRTPRSAAGWVFRSAVSGPSAAAAWPGCVATRPSPP
jgi:RNA polymerase sigma factor (sigma-70 family)